MLVQLDGIARRVNEEGLPVVIDAHGVADGDTVTPKLVHHRVHPLNPPWPMFGGIGASGRCTC